MTSSEETEHWLILGKRRTVQQESASLWQLGRYSLQHWPCITDHHLNFKAVPCSNPFPKPNTFLYYSDLPFTVLFIYLAKRACNNTFNYWSCIFAWNAIEIILWIRLPLLWTHDRSIQRCVTFISAQLNHCPKAVKLVSTARKLFSKCENTIDLLKEVIALQSARLRSPNELLLL